MFDPLEAAIEVIDTIDHRLAARGETMVNRVYHLDRGFERIEHKLSACGAEVERIAGQG